MSKMTRNGGFTLIELLITIVVLSVLIGVAIPSFTENIDRNEVTGTANDLLASILRARSEAVSREVRVNIQRVGADWSRWRVYSDENSNGNYNSATEEEIEDYFHDGPIPVGNAAVAVRVSFGPRGRTMNALDENTAFFQITQGNHTRFLCFSATGRPRVQEGACP
jgi:type IV fimbrial biogenesis protein FimT